MVHGPCGCDRAVKYVEQAAVQRFELARVAALHCAEL